MKILLDENIPMVSAESLKASKHDVKDIRGTSAQGLDDGSLWRMAQVEKRMLITTDKGFTQMRGSYHYGLLVILLSQPNRKAIHDRILMAMKQHTAASWRGQTIVFRDNIKSIFRHKPEKQRKKTTSD